MKKDLKQIELELVKENEDLETRAFEAFVKSKLSELMNEIERAKKILTKWEDKKDNTDLDDYKIMFDQYNPNFCTSNKEHYINKLTGK